MRLYVTLSAVLSILCISGAAAAQDKPAPKAETPAVKAEAPAPKTEAEMLEEIRQLQAQVKELTIKANMLKALAEEKALFSSVPMARRQIVPMDELRNTALPAKPTKDQVRAYVKRIADLSRNQPSFSATDPQVPMLAQAGPDNADVLIEMMDQCPYYILEALRMIVDEPQKKLILDSLAKQYDLVVVVAENKWLEDAKPTLFKELHDKPAQVPATWIRAVATLKDPATYDDLKTCLLRTSEPLEVYLAIKDLPGIDLTQTVATLWQRAKPGNAATTEVVQMAIAYGHKDALEYVMKMMDAPTKEIPFPRTLVLQHIAFRGNNAAIRAWYETNKDKLIFDANTRKFSAPGEPAPPPGKP